jgi:hypothetical protein
VLPEVPAAVSRNCTPGVLPLTPVFVPSKYTVAVVGCVKAARTTDGADTTMR